MDDKLTAKTAKFTSLENLYVYGSCLCMYVCIDIIYVLIMHDCILIIFLQVVMEHLMIHILTFVVVKY